MSTTGVIYEVNIDVAPSIGDAYLAWLRPHIADMRHQIEGLVDVRLTRRPPSDDAAADWVGFTVSYLIETRAALDDYLANRAAAMRQSAVDTFGADNFKAHRRILDLISID